MTLKTIMILFFSIALCHADDIAFKSIFDKAGVDGTLIVASLKNDEVYIYNEKRARTRYTAASTFKIPHTLIALNEKVIQSERDRFIWDGKTREYEAWNRDQTLQSAVSLSCVWCFQQLTQKISKETYRDYLTQFDYGNKTIGDDLSAFWLNGDLKISAYEQIDFLKKLYHEDLPIPHEYIQTVKKIITLEKNSLYDLKGKSGWSGTVGWYVGYLTLDQNVYFFAMNVKLTKEQLHLRKEIVYKALRSKQII